MKDQETGEVIAAPRPFDEWLAEQRNGLTLAELTHDLHELVQGVVDYNKKGTLTFTIDISPAGDGMVEVKDKVKLKAPEPDRSVNMFFIDDEKNMRRNNPRQQRLELREFEEPTPIREVK